MANKPATGAAAVAPAAKPPAWKEARTWIAIIVLGFSIVGVVVLGWTMIWTEEDNKSEVARDVLTTVLPLLGTWVGTVLAFYFSKDNFEAATRSAKELLGVEEKLAAIDVKDVMISEGEMFKVSEDGDGKIVLKEWLDKLDAEKKGQRLPILSSKRMARYVIHRSVFNEFLAYKAIAGIPKADLEKLTLKDLVSERDDLKRLIGSFGAVKQDATLDKVKVIMEQSRFTQDVFVTRNGQIDGEVLGWITNAILDEYSKV